MCCGTYEPHPFYYVCCNSYYGFISRKKIPFSVHAKCWESFKQTLRYRTRCGYQVQRQYWLISTPVYMFTRGCVNKHMATRTLVQLYVSLALVFIPSTWNSAEGTGCSHRPARGEYVRTFILPTPSTPPGRYNCACADILFACSYYSLEYVYSIHAACI